MKLHVINPQPGENLERATLSLRVNVCRDCSRRTGTTPFKIDEKPDCEAPCEVFQKLPSLVATAERVDPLVGSVEQAVLKRIDATTDRNPKKSALRRHRKAVAETLAKVIRN